MSNCINSSKVYCKSVIRFLSQIQTCVLIVAKCIVNLRVKIKEGLIILGINSSKVYCKG